MNENEKKDGLVEVLVTTSQEEQIEAEHQPTKRHEKLGRRDAMKAAQATGDRVLAALEKLNVKADVTDGGKAAGNPQKSKSAKRAMLKVKRKDKVRERLHVVRPCGNPGCVKCYGLSVHERERVAAAVKARAVREHRA
jgi:hypothetical protein